MDAAALLDAHVQLKRIYAALNEALDLTRQLAEAVDRDDQITVQMLVSMREEPIHELRQDRLSALLKGGEAETEAEIPLANQIGLNRRVLKQLVELDRVVNRKLTREKSIYPS